MASTGRIPPPEFSGLKWVRTLWGLEPRWTIDPDETAIKETVKTALSISDPCTIQFLAQGAFNKLYTVSWPGKDVVVRVTLPIEPKWKTLSEIATMDWVRVNTRLPVPKVLAYSTDRSTAIGFEWIVMEKMPGRPWADVWKGIPFSAKQDLVRRVALFCSDCFRNQMRGIGNLFPESPNPEEIQDTLPLDHTLPTSQTTTTPDFEAKQEIASLDSKTLPTRRIQRMVSTAFISNKNQRDVPRGPFPSSRDWLSTRPDFSEADCRRRLQLSRSNMLS